MFSGRNRKYCAQGYPAWKWASLARNPGSPFHMLSVLMWIFAGWAAHRRPSIDVSTGLCLPQPCPCLGKFWALDQLPF